MYLMKGQCGTAAEGGRVWEVRLEVLGPERPGLGDQRSHCGFYSEMGNHWNIKSWSHFKKITLDTVLRIEHIPLGSES